MGNPLKAIGKGISGWYTRLDERETQKKSRKAFEKQLNAYWKKQRKGKH